MKLSRRDPSEDQLPVLQGAPAAPPRCLYSDLAGNGILSAGEAVLAHATMQWEAGRT